MYKNITKQDIKNVREQIQEDLLSMLETATTNEEIKTFACQIIVDNLNPLLDKVD